MGAVLSAVDVVTLSAEVRKLHPMIHHITNSVVMNFTANITLALGAAPVMASSVAESSEMAGFAGALLLNIGTITPDLLKSMLSAGKAANEKGIPVVLDPVGAGATRLRTNAVKMLISELDVSVVRGNAGEILSLAGVSGGVRGVDSIAEAENNEDVFKSFALKTGIVTAVSGEVDYITDGMQWVRVFNGDPMMASVTGTGCGATTAVACFVSSKAPLLQCTAAAIACYNTAGELAAANSTGPGSFVPEFIDQLANLDTKSINELLRVETSG